MSSKLLVEQARKRGITTFFHRNAVGEEMQRIGDSYYRKRHERLQQVTQDKVLIGYGSGTATHNVDFQEVVPALVTLLSDILTLICASLVRLNYPANSTGFQNEYFVSH